MLQGGKRLSWSSLLRVPEGAAISLDSSLDGPQEFAFPFREVHPGPLGLAAGAAQGVEGGPLRRLTRISGAPLQISPIAER